LTSDLSRPCRYAGAGIRQSNSIASIAYVAASAQAFSSTRTFLIETEHFTNEDLELVQALSPATLTLKI